MELKSLSYNEIKLLYKLVSCNNFFPFLFFHILIFHFTSLNKRDVAIFFLPVSFDKMLSFCDVIHAKLCRSDSEQL